MKARYFFIGAIIFGLVAIVGLRSNAKTAISLRDQIVSKDIQAQEVQTDLEELRQYVFKHMNSSIRVELKASYERDKTKAEQAAVSGKVYAQAQASCDRPGDSSVVQAQCVQRYLSTHLTAAEVNLPEPSQYIYAFAAPTWSPDFAGLSLLTAISFGIVALVSYVINLFKNRA